MCNVLESVIRNVLMNTPDASKGLSAIRIPRVNGAEGA